MCDYTITNEELDLNYVVTQQKSTNRLDDEMGCFESARVLLLFGTTTVNGHLSSLMSASIPGHAPS